MGTSRLGEQREPPRGRPQPRVPERSCVSFRISHLRWSSNGSRSLHRPIRAIPLEPGKYSIECPYKNALFYRVEPCSTQVTPVVEFVGIFGPAVADVGAVVHIGDEDVFGAGIDLCLSLLHGLAVADDDENDAGSAGNQPLAVHYFYVFDVDAFHVGLLEDDGVVLGEGFECGVVVKGKRRDDDSNADLKAAARAPLGLNAGSELPKEVADGREHAFLLDADGGITEARSEFERVNAVVVDDAVEVDVADVAFLGELGLHLQKGPIEKQIGLAPEHGSAHLPGGRPHFAGKKLLVLEVDVDRGDEFLAVEESANGDFDAIDAALQLKHFDLFGEGLLVGLQHANDVFAVFFFPDEQAALDVLRFAAGFNDITIGILLDEFNGGVEGVEILVGNDGDAGGLELFLAEGAIVFEAVRVGCAADYGLAGGAESLSLSALAESVVEYDNVGPLGVFFPIDGFGNEAVGDVALFFGLDVVADVVAFF